VSLLYHLAYRLDSNAATYLISCLVSMARSLSLSGPLTTSHLSLRLQHHRLRYHHLRRFHPPFSVSSGLGSVAHNPRSSLTIAAQTTISTLEQNVSQLEALVQASTAAPPTTAPVSVSQGERQLCYQNGRKASRDNGLLCGTNGLLNASGRPQLVRDGSPRRNQWSSIGEMSPSSSLSSTVLSELRSPFHNTQSSLVTHDCRTNS